MLREGNPPLRGRVVSSTQHRAALAAFGSSRSARAVASSEVDRRLQTKRLTQFALCCVTGNTMQRATLEGRSILIIEDEPLIALDLTEDFEALGAKVTTTNVLAHALILAEEDGLSGAVLDYRLADADSSPLCTRLSDRRVPFILYSGDHVVGGACKERPTRSQARCTG